ncbi:hypothetical protein [Coraliomargarita parva]|uniref:hypothetical protein n=1 Tax=Coraliomargarita parva TaxID=3014050 RepID=UPI0022B393A3|nr:hypothetical protein [Coraliomargarita parva]
MKLIVAVLICSLCAAFGGYQIGRAQASRAYTRPTPPEPTSIETEPEPESPTIAEEFYQPVELGSETKPSTEAIGEAAAPEATDYAERDSLPIQTLTDRKGRQLRATILSVIDSQVSIRREDGLTASFPLNRLCDADAAYCQYLQDRQSLPEPSQIDQVWDQLFGGKDS